MNYVAMCKQDCTVWARGAGDGYGGFTWHRRVIKCRWEDRTQMTADVRGQQVASIARVFLLEDVNPGDFLALGNCLKFLPTEEGANAFEIVTFSKTPSLQVSQFTRFALLSRSAHPL